MNKQELKLFVGDYIFTDEELDKLLFEINGGEEIWKDIPGFEGFYQASTFGNVRSLERTVKHSKGGDKTLSAKMMAQSSGSRGYKHIRLCKFGKVYILRVNRIIALTFLHDSILSVDHIDGDILNNNLTNLQYLTPHQNTLKYYLENDNKEQLGTYYDKRVGRWGARIIINGKRKGLGHFSSQKEAHDVYMKELSTIKK